ncbi:MAG: OmpA family protein [Bacteroidota bacterium]|nr:OmpA family protein [Bacteroidota bacterium]MDP4228882.1 OmpA family protein [Bacteroidota bacterium]MDP4234953.1 OmpA family protein [Bacteroidota bacterium]
MKNHLVAEQMQFASISMFVSRTISKWLRRRIFPILIVIASILTSLSTSSAQVVEGRISFGFDGGGNKYWGNFTDNLFGFSGDVFIRWNIEDWLSLHASYNGGLLRFKATPTEPGAGLGTVNHTRHGGWELMASYNVFPEETYVPYFIGGLELLNFEPKDANNNSLPNNAAQAYSKNVLGGVLGVGFEMYISDKVTFNGKGLLHLTGTDWIDDYSNPNDFRQDVFLTFGLGFSYYIFAPPLPAKTEVVTPPSSTTNITNIYTTNIVKGDTVVVRETDTVYKEKVLKGTIYNFPGTLFIVNTDEFNTNMPGNMQNLHNIRTLVNQCPELKVEIQGHASHEGTVARNQELSDMRARKIKAWLIEQGVDPNKIVGTVGLGTSDDAVIEPTNSTPAQLEAARILNRRISIKVVEGCH